MDFTFEKMFSDENEKPLGYRFTAEMVASYMDYIIRHNAEDFREITYIGTEMHG